MEGPRYVLTVSLAGTNPRTQLILLAGLGSSALRWRPTEGPRYIGLM